MLSLERRTASSPCIINSSRLLACCPRVSESARTWFSMAYVRARAFSLTALSMAIGRAHHRIVEARQALGKGGVQRTRALDELDVERLGAACQRGIERHRVVVEHGLQLLRPVGKRCLQAAAGGGELVFQRDQVLARALDDLGELDLLLRQLVDQRGHLAAHRLQRLGYLVGGAHQRMALAGQLLDQPTDLVLVLAVGLLERGHLVVDQAFELAGASERARNGLVHERDLPAHGLSERGSRLLGRRDQARPAAPRPRSSPRT